MKRVFFLTCLLLAAGLLVSGQAQIKFEKYTLANGLRVVVSTDHSSPLVAYAVYYNVGSRNEVPGRTGFAHLFEHMMFQGSANVERNMHHTWLGRAGGNDNGSTSQDRTNYFATVPAGQLELALWLEADRMRSLKITAENFENQRSTVKEERRQSYDNQPYAEGRDIMNQLVFESFPYRHSVIGSMDDLNAAQLPDVQQFFDTYYAPNNAVLALVGDLEPAKAKELVEKYFGPIPGRIPPLPVVVNEPPRKSEKRLTLYDPFANMPAIFAAYSIPQRGEPDAYALQLLSAILVSGDGSRLYQKLVKEKPLAVSVSGGAMPMRGAGLFSISLMIGPKSDASEVWSIALEEVEKLKKAPVSAEELARVKTRMRASMLGRLESCQGRAMLLCESELYDGDAGRVNTEIDRYLKVTIPDLQRVCQKYFTAENRNVVTVLPKSRQPDEAFRKNVPFNAGIQAFAFPAFQKKALANGLEISALRQEGLPRLHFLFRFTGGASYEPAGKTGISTLMAQTLKSGAAALSQKQIADKLDALGASIFANSGPDAITISIACEPETMPQVLDLAADILLRPTFPAEEVKKEVVTFLSRLQQSRTAPVTLASEMLYRQVFANHPYARISTPARAPYVNIFQVMPTAEFLGTVAADEVAAYHRSHFIPNGCSLAVVGSLPVEEVFSALEKRFGGWAKGTAAAPAEAPAPPIPQKRVIHLVNRPGSVQSYILLGNLLFERSHADCPALMVANKILGGGRHIGGGATGRLFMNLREEKGWTYGCYSWIMCFARSGIFAINAEVNTNVTAPALQEILKEIDRMQRGDFNADDLKYAKSFLTGVLPLLMEGSGVLDGWDEATGAGLAADYWNHYSEEIGAVDFNRCQQAAQKYIASKNSVVVVVGDAAKIKDSLRPLGDEIIVYDTMGKRTE